MLPPAYFTQLPVKKLRDCLIQAGIPAKTSSSAGLYVCNRTYVAALHHIATTGRSTKAVFIHLPKISDEWPAERMRTAIILIINNIITMAKKTTAAKPAAKKTTTAKPAAKKATTTKKTTTKAAAKPAAKPAAKTVEKKATEISVTGNKKIGTLMKDFNKKFPYLRLGIFYSYAREQVAKGETIYNIDVEKTLASVRRADSGGDISISGNKKIKSLEKEFDTVFGLYAQVCYTTAEGNRYYTSRGLDDYTLAAFNAKCEKDGCKKGEWK